MNTHGRTRSGPGSDGRATRWDAHREERHADLVMAAVAAIDRWGAAASIAQIADEAGVSKPVIYRYFTDKDQVHRAVGEWGADLVLARVREGLAPDVPVRQRVLRACDGYLSVIEEHPQVFVLLIRSGIEAGDPLAGGRARIAGVLSRFLRDAFAAAGVDSPEAMGAVDLWAAGFVGLGLSIGERWIEQAALPRAEVARHLSDFIWHALDGIAAEFDFELE